MPKEIKGFFGDYRFLSNYFCSKVTFEHVEYETVEHAYQAAKSENTEEREAICRAKFPNEAKRLGRKVTLRPDWEKVKLHIMEDLVYKKFQHKALKERLLATGDAHLEETNYWHDNFFGSCTCSKCFGLGRNHLGQILMRVREELKNESA
jgi:ribA/ribD-fused uncharacterized protein